MSATACAAWTLARLAFVRTLPLAAIVVFAAVFAYARVHELARAATLPEPGALASLRSACWTLALVLGAPFLVARAARTFARWRTGELDFLVPRASAPAFIAFASWCGSVAAFVLLGGAAALASEAGVRDAPAFRATGEIAIHEDAWITGARPWSARVALAEQPAGARLAVELVLGSGGGPAAEVVLDATRADSRASCTAAARVGSRGALEVEIPRGAGELVLALHVTDPATRVYFAPQRARLWSPVAGTRGASLALFARFVLAGAAASALALGLGAFMAPYLASSLVLALWLLPDVLGVDPAWIPARDLFDALDVAARGRVPALPPLVAVCGALAIAAVALAPCAFGRAAWRRTR